MHTCISSFSMESKTGTWPLLPLKPAVSHTNPSFLKRNQSRITRGFCLVLKDKALPWSHACNPTTREAEAGELGIRGSKNRNKIKTNKNVKEGEEKGGLTSVPRHDLSTSYPPSLVLLSLFDWSLLIGAWCYGLPLAHSPNFIPMPC